MFRWSIVGTVFLVGVGLLASFPLSVPAADGNPADPPSLGEPGQPVVNRPGANPSVAGKAPVKKPGAKPGSASSSHPSGTVIAPLDSGPDSNPTTAPAAPAIPGLGDFLRPDGFVIPGGIGSIQRAPDHIGIQINTPDGPVEINIPRRQRAAQSADEPSSPGSEAEPPQPGGRESLNSIRSSRDFASAARQFRARNYPVTLRRINRYLERDPGDRDLLQLRSLVNFALADYPAAYRDALAALNEGEVWDWSTLRSLYRSAGEYTTHYRALEEFVAANPNSTTAAFLFAYHNLMLGNHDVASREFGRVAALDASNETARRLAKGEGPPHPLRSTSRPPGATSAGPASLPQGKAGSGPAVDLGQPAPLSPPDKANPKASH
jgi:hypothetical protein